MSSPHQDPERHGITFGRAVVTVDLMRGDCVVTAPQAGPICTIARRMRLNSVDEIRGAYAVQQRLACTAPSDHPHAPDIARALAYAGQTLKAHQQRK